MPNPGKYFQKPGGHSEGFLENFSRLFSEFLISGHEWEAFLENFSSWISWLPTKEKMILEIGSWLRGVSGKFFQTNFIYTYSGKNALKKLSGNFDVINFELKYLKKVIYEVYCDIMSRCTSPPPIDATWLIPIFVHGDVTRE